MLSGNIFFVLVPPTLERLLAVLHTAVTVLFLYRAHSSAGQVWSLQWPLYGISSCGVLHV
jgi:hypothetical protein